MIPARFAKLAAGWSGGGPRLRSRSPKSWERRPLPTSDVAATTRAAIRPGAVVAPQARDGIGSAPSGSWLIAVGIAACVAAIVIDEGRNPRAGVDLAERMTCAAQLRQWREWAGEADLEAMDARQRAEQAREDLIACEAAFGRSK